MINSTLKFASLKRGFLGFHTTRPAMVSRRKLPNCMKSQTMYLERFGSAPKWQLEFLHHQSGLIVKFKILISWLKSIHGRAYHFLVHFLHKIISKILFAGRAKHFLVPKTDQWFRKFHITHSITILPNIGISEMVLYPVSGNGPSFFFLHFLFRTSPWPNRQIWLTFVYTQLTFSDLSHA